MQVSPLAAWSNYYVIIGSAAATLTGLMFVVITLVAGVPTRRRSSSSIAAFNTPSVVYFCVSIFMAALFNAPWQALWQVSILLGLCGLAGVIYVIIVLQRTRRQDRYQMVLEDWIWHVIIPLLSFVVLVVAAILLPLDPVQALFGIGAVSIMLLFIGLHNSWDTVVFILLKYSSSLEQKKEETEDG